MLSFCGYSATDAAKPPTASFCHSLVVPSEPEIVPTADLFEHWIAERRLREYCHDKDTTLDVGTDGLSEDGRSKVPTLLGFDQDRILQEAGPGRAWLGLVGARASDAERFLGAKPGNLMGQSPEEDRANPDNPRRL
eukprot:s4265_g1.t1